MPMIDVYAAAGTFPDGHQLAADLAAPPSPVLARRRRAGAVSLRIPRVRAGCEHRPGEVPYGANRQP